MLQLTLSCHPEHLRYYLLGFNVAASMFLALAGDSNTLNTAAQALSFCGAVPFLLFVERLLVIGTNYSISFQVILAGLTTFLLSKARASDEEAPLIRG